jgi:hypothetical protein
MATSILGDCPIRTPSGDLNQHVHQAHAAGPRRALHAQLVVGVFVGTGWSNILLRYGSFFRKCSDMIAAGSVTSCRAPRYSRSDARRCWQAARRRTPKAEVTRSNRVGYTRHVSNSCRRFIAEILSGDFLFDIDLLPHSRAERAHVSGSLDAFSRPDIRPSRSP